MLTRHRASSLTTEVGGTRIGASPGQFARLVVQYLRIGPIQIITMPGEFSPELVVGVPADFDTPEGEAKYFLRPDVHYTGARFTLPGACGRLDALFE